MIKDNLRKVKERISSACSKIGRPADSVTIVCVSKGRAIEQIKEAIAAGLSDIGENKVQEAKKKYGDLRSALSAQQVKWHMVGHLQTNKVRDALSIFDLIQSVDSAHLADTLNREAARINKAQDILLEVKTSQGETAKSGLKCEEVWGVVDEMAKFKNINIKGLMTIAPLVDEPEKSRPYFQALRKLRDKIDKRWILSMGMSGDFEVAIEEGADMIRLGRAIFE